MLKQFSIAFRHLSFLSQYQPRPTSPEELGRSTVYFPLVGFVFGLSLMIFYYCLSGILGEELTCLLMLLLFFLFFNGRQYQACINYFPGASHLSTSPPGNDVFRAALLFFLFMFKFLALLHIGKGWILGVLVLLPTVSCWSLVYLSHSLAFGSDGDSGQLSYTRFVRTREFWGATFFATVAAILFLQLKGLFLLMMVSLWTSVFEKFFLLKRGENTNAVMGVVMELSEVSFLITAIIMRKGFSLVPAEGILL